jgi:hypothetical protein
MRGRRPRSRQLQGALARAQAAPASLALEAPRSAGTTAVTAAAAATAARLLVGRVAPTLEAERGVLAGRSAAAVAAASSERATSTAAIAAAAAKPASAAAASAVAATTAAVAAAALTGGPAWALLCLIHIESTTADFALVEQLDRFAGFLRRRERGEREPARPTCDSISGDVDIDDLTRFRENLRQLFSCSLVAQVPDKDLGRNGDTPSGFQLTRPTREGSVAAPLKLPGAGQKRLSNRTK